MTVTWRALALAVGACVALGCAGPSGYGESVRAALRAQAAPAKRHTNAVEGLDSQEAAIIAGTYRRSLAPKDERPASNDVIYVQPSGTLGPARPPPRAPSVPKE